MPAGDQEQVLPDCEGGKEEVVIEDGRDLAAERNGVRINQEAIDLDVPCKRRLPAGDGPCHGRLPCAVDAYDSQYFSGRHRGRYLATYRIAGIAHTQAFNLKNRPHGVTLP